MAERRSNSERSQTQVDDNGSDYKHHSSEKNAVKKDEVNQEENDQEGPPLPVSFWHSSLKKARLSVLKGWAMTTLILMTFIFCVLCLYYGVLNHVEQNRASLTVAVVDFDGQVAPYTNVVPLIGPAVVRAAMMQRQQPQSIGYVMRSPADYNYDPVNVRRSIHEERDWAAIIINPNATALLQAAVASGNQSYDPMGAAQIVYIQARDQETYSSYITPALSQFTTNFQAMFGRQWVQSVLSNTTLQQTTYSRAPQALNPAIGFAMFDLRPFTPPKAIPTVTIALIYLIIMSFFSFGFFIPHHMKLIKPEGHPPVHFWQMCIWRLLATIVAYFFLSLAYSLVPLAFDIPFSNTFAYNDVTTAVAPNAYGRASFVVFWMINWIGMAALGLASENVTMAIGQPWTAMWLVFWVISNVSTGFYPLDLAPGFYKWGYAFPMYHIVHATRTIIYDVRSEIGLNVGVLCAWVLVHCLLYFPCCVLMKWKSSKEMAKKAPRSTMRFLLDG